MDFERFPLQVQGYRFEAFYQRGTMDVPNSRWKRDDNGPDHLVVCAWGRGAYRGNLDDAVCVLQHSYVIGSDCSHHHTEETFPCNVIEALKDGDGAWVMGAIVVPELLKDIDF